MSSGDNGNILLARLAPRITWMPESVVRSKRSDWPWLGWLSLVCQSSSSGLKHHERRAEVTSSPTTETDPPGDHDN
eukprot:2970540-Rhodomonas_salina.1